MKLAIGVDLGGTNLRAALVREDGEVLQLLREKTPVQDGPAATATLIARMCGDLVRIAQPASVLGIGIGSPGPLSRAEKKILDTPNLPGFDGFPMGQRVQDISKLEVRLDNDAKCAAYGEGFFGQARNVEDYLLLTFGTGIGGGVVVNGRMLYGKGDGACELGHVTLHPGGRLCPCGNQGCVEQYISATAIERRATAALGAPASAKDLIEAHVSGKNWAQTCLREVVVDIAIACASFVNAFDPSVIVLGGGVFSTGGGPICAMVQAEIRDRCFKSSQAGLSIVASALGGNAGVLGAASLVLRE